RNDRQHDLRGMGPVMVDAEGRGLGLSGNALRLSALQIARIEREEGARYLYPDAMPLFEDIAGDRTLEIDGVDLSRLEQLAALGHFPVARPLHINSRGHLVPDRTIRSD